jgi:hypothetical protein
MRRPLVSMQGTTKSLVICAKQYHLPFVEIEELGKLKSLCVKTDEKSVYDKWKERKGNESLGEIRKVGREEIGSLWE